MSASPQLGHSLKSAAATAARRSVDYLSSVQRPDGHWCALLTADSTLESDFILFQLWLHAPVNGVWEPESGPQVDKAVRTILDKQLPDGGFNIYLDGPSEISASVKAYFALKVAGIPAADERMTRLRDRILALGGIQAANSYVKVNLSLFDLYPREFCPAIPPEIALLPFNLMYQMSSWTRTIVMPLAITHSSNPRRPVPAGFTLEELWLPGAGAAFRNEDGFFSWRNFFLKFDLALKWWERHGSKALRRKAVERAGQWMIRRFEQSDGLGAIYPPMQYAVMALDVMGYAADHPLRVDALKKFNALMVESEDRLFFQPCFSPVWDTAIAAYALGEAGASAPVLRDAADWLLAREIRYRGDWAVKRKKTEPSGWAFFYENIHSPDIDDSAMVMLALAVSRGSDSAAQQACHRRGSEWLIAMQSGDGGWAAFDADNDWQFLNHVPFADHNAMLDPTCPDITGRVLESLAAHGVANEHPSVRRGVKYLVDRQEPDGSWYGRWGVAYIYGTCFALRGLAASGESDREAYVLRGGEWLRSIQNADGGWGESCASYDHGSYVAGPSTPSQTAWAIMGLIAGGDTHSLSVRHGIEYLLETQGADGSWRERPATGTGFPRVFYLNYHMYKDYFPLIALSAFIKAQGGQGR